MPKGASDFAISHYTYDDLPPGASDAEPASFSVARDEAAVLPVARAIAARAPRVRFMATPWSAPAWMKTSESLVGGELRAEHYPTYAAHFARFLDACRARGLTFDALTVPNEPHFEPPDYPGTRWEPGEQADFVKKTTRGPRLAAAGHATKIVAWDHNRDEPDFPLGVLGDPAAEAYVAGSAFHCYAGSVEAQSRSRDARPDRGVYFTKSTGGAFAPDFADDLRFGARELLVNATRNWARTARCWNSALDPSGGGRTSAAATIAGAS